MLHQLAQDLVLLSFENLHRWRCQSLSGPLFQCSTPFLQAQVAHNCFHFPNPPFLVFEFREALVDHPSCSSACLSSSSPDETLFVLWPCSEFQCTLLISTAAIACSWDVLANQFPKQDKFCSSEAQNLYSTICLPYFSWGLNSKVLESLMTRLPFTCTSPIFSSFLLCFWVTNPAFESKKNVLDDHRNWLDCFYSTGCSSRQQSNFVFQSSLCLQLWAPCYLRLHLLPLPDQFIEGTCTMLPMLVSPPILTPQLSAGSVLIPTSRGKLQANRNCFL